MDDWIVPRSGIQTNPPRGLSIFPFDGMTLIGPLPYTLFSFGYCSTDFVHGTVAVLDSDGEELGIPTPYLYLGPFTRYTSEVPLVAKGRILSIGTYSLRYTITNDSYGEYETNTFFSYIFFPFRTPQQEGQQSLGDIDRGGGREPFYSTADPNGDGYIDVTETKEVIDSLSVEAIDSNFKLLVYENLDDLDDFAFYLDQIDSTLSVDQFYPFNPSLLTPDEFDAGADAVIASVRASTPPADLPEVNAKLEVVEHAKVVYRMKLNPPSIVLAMTPTGPLTVAPGGSISFAYTITNTSGVAATGDLFFVARRSGNVVARGIVRSGTLPDGQAVSASTTLRVPTTAPSGTYDLTFSIGRAFGVAVDSETFTVSVEPGPALSDGIPTWSVVEAPPWQVQPADGAAPKAKAKEQFVKVYPNPFQGQTTIRYEVAEATEVRLAVYDVLGREVAVLVDGQAEAGTHGATFDARGLAAGTYIYRLLVGNQVQAGRLTVLY